MQGRNTREKHFLSSDARKIVPSKRLYFDNTNLNPWRERVRADGLGPVRKPLITQKNKEQERSLFLVGQTVKQCFLVFRFIVKHLEISQAIIKMKTTPKGIMYNSLASFP